MSIILVVVAHPDDEILGVGATIAKRVKSGDTAYALILAEGQTSRWDNRECADATAVELLHRDTFESAKIVGYKNVFFGDLPDNRMDSCDLLDIVKCVEKYVKQIKPDIIYTHYSGDLNIDHELTTRAVLTATRPIGSYTVKEIYAFETVSSTEWNFDRKNEQFAPNVFEDVSKYFDIKCEAMKKYSSELCEFPHPRSLKMLDALAVMRGSTIGVQKAEAFELVRKVNL